MGNLDVPKVIQAAASSNLGVLSLLVLVLAFLAWRFFQRSDDRVKLVAFGMIFLGAIGFGTSIFVATGSPKAQTVPTPAPSASATPSDAPTPVATGRVATPDIAGDWHGDDGWRFRFTQQVTQIRYESLHKGKPAGTGEGTIEGRALRYRFVDTESGDRGRCEGTLSEDGRTVKGTCQSDGGGTPWDLWIQR